MTKRFSYVVRRIMPIMSAGLLFQAGGCAFDANALVSSLASTIATNLINSFVFGAFNLTSP